MWSFVWTKIEHKTEWPWLLRLVLLLRHFAAKSAPFTYLDTHAGDGLIRQDKFTFGIDSFQQFFTTSFSACISYPCILDSDHLLHGRTRPLRLAGGSLWISKFSPGHPHFGEDIQHASTAINIAKYIMDKYILVRCNSFQKKLCILRSQIRSAAIIQYLSQMKAFNAGTTRCQLWLQISKTMGQWELRCFLVFVFLVF